MVSNQDVGKRVKVEDEENRSTWFGTLIKIEGEMGTVKDSYNQSYNIELKNIKTLEY
jgi:ribosome maturation factor RimP